MSYRDTKVQSIACNDDLVDVVDRWLHGHSVMPALGMPSFQKSAVFLNIVQKAFDPPPPFYLNICPILQVVFFAPHI